MRSNIDGRLDQVMRLTSLVSLDLMSIQRIIGCTGTKAMGQMHGQRVFKFAGCRLIDKFTAWDIAAVTELHTDMMTPGMETANIHFKLVVRHTHANVLRFLSSLASLMWCTYLEGLHVAATDL